MSGDKNEQREFIRVTRQFAVRCRVVVEAMFQHLLKAGDFEQTPLEELADEDAFETRTTDISQGGLVFMGISERDLRRLFALVESAQNSVEGG
jgi:hypothetical protein